LAKKRVAPELSDALLYVSTAIAGFMTAFFANKMGVEVPENGRDLRKEDVQIPKRTFKQKFTAWIKRVSDWIDRALCENIKKTKIIIGSIDLVVYFLVALTAIITWVSVPDVTPDIVKNVASISVTMFLGIAKGVLDTIE